MLRTLRVEGGIGLHKVMEKHLKREEEVGAPDPTCQ